MARFNEQPLSPMCYVSMVMVSSERFLNTLSNRWSIYFFKNCVKTSILLQCMFFSVFFKHVWRWSHGDYFFNLIKSARSLSRSLPPDRISVWTFKVAAHTVRSAGESLMTLSVYEGTAFSMWQIQSLGFTVPPNFSYLGFAFAKVTA